jgi:hypothetical protein
MTSRTNDALSQESQRDDPKRSLGPSKTTKGQGPGHRLRPQPLVNTWSSHQFTKLKDASPQGRAHAQSPGNPVRLLWLDESHDAIRTRIHDEMSQPLCFTPTQFGNYKVLSQKDDAFSTSTYAASSLKICYAYNVVLHRSRRLIHSNRVLHLTETPYILSLRMSRKERIYPLTPQSRVMANCRGCWLDLT